jgi:hypothetical protein
LGLDHRLGRGRFGEGRDREIADDRCTAAVIERDVIPADYVGGRVDFDERWVFQ